MKTTRLSNSYGKKSVSRPTLAWYKQGLLRPIGIRSHGQICKVVELRSSKETAPIPPAWPSDQRGQHLSVNELQDYMAGWDSQPYEYDYYVNDAWVEGELPAELQGGTLFAAGPGLTKAYGSQVRNPVDGDGMLWSLAVAPRGGGNTTTEGRGSRAFFRNRFVRTGSFTAEQIAGRRLSRGLHDRGAPASDGSGPGPLPEALLELLSRAANAIGNANTAASVSIGPLANTTSSSSSGSGRSSSTTDASWGAGSSSGSSTGSGGSGGATKNLPLAPGVGKDAFWGSSFGDNPFSNLVTMASAATAGVMSSAGPLGPVFNPLDMTFRQTANAGVLYWAGSLYALTEHGLPHEMNKLTLETVGQSSIGGLLAGSPALVANWKICTAPGSYPEASSAVHAAHVTAGAEQNRVLGAAVQQQQGQQRLVLLTAGQSGPDTALHFRELDTAGKVVLQTQYRVSRCIARFITDFLVTEHHYIVVQGPLNLNLERLATRYALGEASFAECMDFEVDKPARLHLIPRSSSAGHKGKPPGAVVVDLPALVSTHAVQACEVGWGSNQVVLDMVVQQGLPFYKDMNELLPGYYKGQPKPELTRIVVDTASKVVVSSQVLSHRAVELGVVACPTRNGAGLSGTLFAAASASEDRENWGPPQVLTKLRVPPQLGLPQSHTAAADGPQRRSADAWRGCSSETWRPGPRSYLGPLVMVPKAEAREEGDVWIVTTVHTAGSSQAEIVVLDGAQLWRGPICSIQLPHALPFPRALQWVPRYLGPARAAPASWKPKAPVVRQ